MEAQEPCCRIEKLLAEHEIQILDSDKMSEGAHSFIVYKIKIEDVEVKRRYSEFESLRSTLLKLHPSCIIPPLPEKTSLAQYATKQNRAKNDVLMIQKRKRMLQSFLKRISMHFVLSKEHIFHRFFEDLPWSEVVQSVPAANSKKADSPTSSAMSHSRTNSESTVRLSDSLEDLRKPDPRFQECETYTSKFEHSIANTEKAQRKLTKKLGDLAADYSEFGACLNAVSLNESEELASAIERVGQAVDSSFLSTKTLANSLQYEFNEPLQEYEQYSVTIRKILKARGKKYTQLEGIIDSLKHKKAALEELEKSEAESKRLEEVLRSSDAPEGPEVHSLAATDQVPELENGVEELQVTDLSNGSNGTSAGETSTVTKRRSFLGKISHKIHGIVDNDPEATRRLQITKNRDQIESLEDQLEECSQDLSSTSSEIQLNLDFFQRQKEYDLRGILLNYAKAHLAWCQTNLQAWQEASEEVDKITE
ncbi:PX-domain-containing protein [Basidiobolus meristosporus CBS 931.73]|uniref:PX-domain-containing protein n=1 Tax=Basidiobolus meristosporus CBS 931.73 TaxID=1314790 RepID=A0A1Y1Y4X2_9FUNG|nr:PX-domain-containing protein [Basidiobolus meristosporus CBS 931.73]|eukprot:ORX92654.1 PX-domain-containing protein [Basidiobolus meristosporus CBS 931.73]